jgi:predicted Zn-dependent protease
VAHEFGHVLGLSHCLDCDSVMSYDWQTRGRTFVTELDVLTFRALMQQPNGFRVDGRPLGSLRSSDAPP